ncbi:MAG: peptidoglycan-associated lipoprotein Pal [Gammaproteobacteria bacterium]
MKRIFATIAISGLMVLAGCASQPETTAPPAMTAGTAPAAASTSGAQTTGTMSGMAMSGAEAQKAGPASTYENRVVYFDFNQSVVKPEAFQTLRDQAAYLTAHSAAQVLLAGYCDERGTREYNIGLGARRAAAVRKFLLLQGVDADQIKTISYGEAYPADPGHNEAAWAKNRRVVISYQVGAGQ